MTLSNDLNKRMDDMNKNMESKLDELKDLLQNKQRESIKEWQKIIYSNISINKFIKYFRYHNLAWLIGTPTAFESLVP